MALLFGCMTSLSAFWQVLLASHVILLKNTNKFLIIELLRYGCVNAFE